MGGQRQEGDHEEQPSQFRPSDAGATQHDDQGDQYDQFGLLHELAVVERQKDQGEQDQGQPQAIHQLQPALRLSESLGEGDLCVHGAGWRLLWKQAFYCIRNLSEIAMEVPGVTDADASHQQLAPSFPGLRHRP